MIGFIFLQLNHFFLTRSLISSRFCTFLLYFPYLYLNKTLLLNSFLFNYARSAKRGLVAKYYYIWVIFINFLRPSYSRSPKLKSNWGPDLKPNLLNIQRQIQRNKEDSEASSARRVCGPKIKIRRQDLAVLMRLDQSH